MLTINTLRDFKFIVVSVLRLRENLRLGAPWCSHNCGVAKVCQRKVSLEKS